MSEPIRVFIGGGKEHWLPITVLAHSIRKHTDREVEITPLREVEKRIRIPKKWFRWAPTSFSFQRFLIPRACGYQGKGVYLDSDMVVRADIGELWDTEFPDGATVVNTGNWQSAVMLVDCERARWDIDVICGKLDRGEWKYGAACNLKYPELCTLAGAIDPLWNVIDRPMENMEQNADRAKLLHFTDMNRQPWLRIDHPCAGHWFAAVSDALDAGVITREEIGREIDAGHIRPSLAFLAGRAQTQGDEAFIVPDRRRKA